MRAALVWLPIHTNSLAQSTSQTNEVQVRFEVRLHTSAQVEGDLFLAGNHQELGNWKPDGLKLTRQSDGTYFAEARLPVGTELEYKVTQGSWLSVEKNSQGVDIENRNLRILGPAVDEATVDNKQICNVQVLGWGSQQPPKSTVLGNVHLHHPNASQGGSLDRRVAVWLPPGYEQTDMRYPVLYLHDGQNLFDSATAAFGNEWQIDETATRLIEQGKIQPLIIVGIWNTRDRIQEYTPAFDSLAPENAMSAENVERGGDQYLSLLVKTIKPLVDQSYRTKPEREHTAIGGSSLGGLISLYSSVKHKDVFSGYAAISPSLGWNNEEFLKRLEAEPALAGNFADSRVWIDMGTREGSTAIGQQTNVERTDRLLRVLNRVGLDSENEIRHWVVPEGQHNEKAWAERFGSVLEFLFPVEN
jgi:predicted alpha/beta superfamily hydrolase